jgi:hypothetical protein
VFRSYFPQDKLPKDPTGKWSCETYTVNGQLVGVRKFDVLTPDGEAKPEAPKTETPAPRDAGVSD